MSNRNLHAARKAKNDEFYTQYKDVEKEIQHYDLRGKTVYCNCDDYRHSNFVKYFKDNFKALGITKITATNKDIGEGAYLYTYDGVNETATQIEDGDFRSELSINILQQSDIVITNPPFSLFREYVAQLMEYEKKFLIIGSDNARTYKETFPLLKENKMWIGINHIKDFVQPDKSIKSFGNISWFTNMEHSRRNEPLDLYKKYNPTKYPKYDNYDAIEVSKVSKIPMDYDGVMGVPITFLDKYCPEQFEIVGMAEDNGKGQSGKESKWDGLNPHSVINGKNMYKRIFIKRKKNEE